MRRRTLFDKVAVVTGASSGIGRAVARLLTQRGAHVSIIARRQELLDETLAELERRRENKAQWLSAYSADLADWEQARQAVTTLTEIAPPTSWSTRLVLPTPATLRSCRSTSSTRRWTSTTSERCTLPRQSCQR